eukprot:353596-Chlamydomonas_euryale.AAC.11
MPPRRPRRRRRRPVRRRRRCCRGELVHRPDTRAHSPPRGAAAIQATLTTAASPPVAVTCMGLSAWAGGAEFATLKAREAAARHCYRRCCDRRAAGRSDAAFPCTSH